VVCCSGVLQEDANTEGRMPYGMKLRYHGRLLVLAPLHGGRLCTAALN
jgi:hypothetical protein